MVQSFQWKDLDAFKRWGSFSDQYPANIRRFFAPVDQVHEAILHVLKACNQSLSVGMYGFDDEDISAVLKEKWSTEHLPVQVSLDSTQEKGTHEKALLIKDWPQDVIGNSFAYGHSSKAAISHFKLFVVDGLVTIQGSTNVSGTGESKQNNECTFVLDPVFAAETKARLDIVHQEMLAQMRAKDVTAW